MLTQQEDVQAAVPAALEENARHTLQRLRSALAESITSVGTDWNPNTGRLSSLGVEFGIDKKLAWKIGRVVRAEDPIEAAKNLPGQAGLEKYLAAAGKRGVPVVCLERVRAAFGEYQALMRKHAPDRASFETMISGAGGAAASDGSPDRTEQEQRKAAFRANAYLFGVQARLQVRADFLNLSATEGMMDLVSVRGFVDLVRTRVDVSWPVGRMYYRDDAAAIREPARREPVDPAEDTEVGGGGAGGVGGAPLLRRFCSQPLPALRAGVTPQGAPEAMLEGGTVGKTGAVTCLTGEISRAHAPIWRDERNRFTGAAVRCFTPCEALLCDQFVHRDLFGRVEYDVLRVSELYRYATGDAAVDRMRLPMHERVVYLGTGLDVVSTAAYPRQREVAAHVMGRMGWKAEEFFVYRLMIEYPVVPSCVFLEHVLPERGEVRR